MGVVDAVEDGEGRLNRIGLGRRGSKMGKIGLSVDFLTLF